MECILSKELENLRELNKILKLKLANIEETFNVPVSDADKLKYIKVQIEQSQEAEEYLDRGTVTL